MTRLYTITAVSAALLSCSFSYSSGPPGPAGREPAAGKPVAGKPARPSTGKPARPPTASEPPTAPRPPTAAAKPPTRPPAGATVDKLFHGGPIVTMRVDDAGKPIVAEALAVDDGKIVAVGALSDIEPLVHADTEKIDLAGKALLPGFIDGHGHLSAAALGLERIQLGSPPVGGVRSISEMQRTLRAEIKQNKIPAGEWVVGWNYDDSRLRERRQPTRDDLDAVSTVHPIAVYHHTGAIAVVNTPALRLLNIDADTVDPQGGVIVRRANSRQPNGVLEQRAVMMVTRALPRPDDHELMRLLARAERDYARRGFTTVQDGAVLPHELAALRQLARSGGHIVDVVAYPVVEALPDLRRLADERFGVYERGVKLGGIKLILDGELQTRTAWLSRPYAAPPPGKPRGWRGAGLMAADDLEQILEVASERGWQVLAHANGDAAADQFLDAWEHVLERRKLKDARPVLLHAQTVREDQLDRMRDAGVMASFNSSQIYYWGDWYRDNVLGRARAERLDPARAALARELPFTLHDDSPMVPIDPMLLLSSAVTRATRSGQVLGADQRVGAFDGLRGLTSRGAYQYFEEADKGELAVGRVADLVVVDHNPLSVRTGELSTLRVLATYKAGATTFAAAPPE